MAEGSADGTTDDENGGEDGPAGGAVARESQARFARWRGVRPWTLWYWSRKAAPVTAPTFVPVQVTATDEAPPIEIALPDGVRVAVHPAPATVSALVAALRARC